MAVGVGRRVAVGGGVCVGGNGRYGDNRFCRGGYGGRDGRGRNGRLASRQQNKNKKQAKTVTHHKKVPGVGLFCGVSLTDWGE